MARMTDLWPETKRIFVFGSNLAGRHGKGAALHAVKKYGAKYGVFEGHHNQSYAIPTKNRFMAPLRLKDVSASIDSFLTYSMSNPSLEFNVTQIGCGLAGFDPAVIAPLFNIPASARTNLWFDREWEKYLEPGPTNFWTPPI